MYYLLGPFNYKYTRVTQARYYSPRSETSEGYVFTGVCYSFGPQVRGGLAFPRMHRWSHDHSGQGGLSSWREGGGSALLAKGVFPAGKGSLPSWQGESALLVGDLPSGGGQEGRPRRQTPPGRQRTSQYGQCAGGTHPTGMHPCLNVCHSL